MAASFSACGIERKPPTGWRYGGRSGKHSQSDPESVRSGAMTRPADALTLPSELVVLGIETSCDETAAAVVTARGKNRANLVLSPPDAHRPYCGAAPALAARPHLDTTASPVGPGLAHNRQQ